MANYGDFKGALDYIISLLKKIDRHTECAVCNVAPTTTAGAGIDVPAGLRSVAIVKTSADGTVNVTMSDTSVYAMTAAGEVIVDSATGDAKLPAYPISGDGTWKWHGIK